MGDLRHTFGRLLAAHRRRKGLTQEALAEAAGLSVDMISKIESGSSGARFPSIERLAAALKIDAAELFSSDFPSGTIRRGAFANISARLANLSEADLEWIGSLLDAALARGRATTNQPRLVRTAKHKMQRAPAAKRKKTL